MALTRVAVPMFRFTPTSAGDDRLKAYSPTTADDDRLKDVLTDRRGR